MASHASRYALLFVLASVSIASGEDAAAAAAATEKENEAAWNALAAEQQLQFAIERGALAGVKEIYNEAMEAKKIGACSLWKSSLIAWCFLVADPTACSS
jgi:hypothetical protein